MSVDLHMPDINIAPALPSIEMPSFEMAPDLDISMPEIDITPAGLEYSGDMEWTVADQAAFEGAVVEHQFGEGLDADPSEHEDYSWTPTTREENKTVAQEYFEFEAETGRTPLSETSLLDALQSPEVLEEGIWLSDIQINDPDEDNLSPQLKKSRGAAIKFLAAELGMGVEDVEVERGDEILIDSFLHPYPLDELPRAPYQIDGQFFCEDEQITMQEALQVEAARKLSTFATKQKTLSPTIVDTFVKTEEHFGNQDNPRHFTLKIDLDKPGFSDTQINVGAELLEVPFPIDPAVVYEHIVDTPKEDKYATLVDSSAVPKLPHIKHVASSIKGYNIDRYEYQGESPQGQSKYTAILK